VVVARNLGRAGVAGEFATGDPHSRAIDGMSVYANIAGLPRALDLAVIAAARDCGASDQRTEPAWHARVRSHYHRFGGSGELGRALPQAMLEAAKPNLLRIVGPSCVGIMLPRLGLDATFSHIAVKLGCRKRHKRS